MTDTPLAHQMSTHQQHDSTSAAALIEQLQECGRLFYSRGWSVGTSSNYSAVLRRDPLEMIITVSGKDKGRLAEHDFVRVGSDGQSLDADAPRSSAETLLHVVAAEDPSTNAVLHTHSVWATVLSDYYFDEGAVTLEDFEMLKGLNGVTTHEHIERVEIFDNTQDIPDLANRVRARMRATDLPSPHGYLIRNHGLYTWGRDIAEARRHIEVFEFLFECVGRRLSLLGGR